LRRRKVEDLGPPPRRQLPVRSCRSA
jgi:hypothetical protein